MSIQPGDHTDTTTQLLERVNQLTEYLESRTRPYIAIDLHPRGSVNILYMRIRNIGQSPALDVEITFDRPIKIRERTVDQFNVFRNIPVMAANDSIAFFYDSAIELFKGENRDTAFSGQVAYSDTSGKRYKNEFKFDTEMFRNLALVTEGQFEHDLKSEVERLRRELEEISRVFKDMRMKALLAEWEQQQADTGSTPQEPTETVK